MACSGVRSSCETVARNEPRLERASSSDACSAHARCCHEASRRRSSSSAVCVVINRSREACRSLCATCASEAESFQFARSRSRSSSSDSCFEAARATNAAASRLTLTPTTKPGTGPSVEAAHTRGAPITTLNQTPRISAVDQHEGCQRCPIGSIRPGVGPTNLLRSNTTLMGGRSSRVGGHQHRRTEARGSTDSGTDDHDCMKAIRSSASGASNETFSRVPG
jgi:hypothetical protein